MVSGMTVQAVGLVESGVLVNGWTVTDLLSGYAVRGEPPVDEVAGGVTATVTWKNSGVPLARLESVRELVAEVLEVRAADPELTSPNPQVPRVLFPWGVGEARTDVLVTGPDDRVTAAYLRSVGVRARCVDRDAALRLAADLEMARSELAELEGGPDEDLPEEDLPEEWAGDLPDRSPALRRPVVVAAVVAVGVLVVVGIVAAAGLSGGDGTASASAPTSSPAPPVTVTSVVSSPSAAPWQDPVRHTAGGSDGSDGTDGTDDAPVSTVDRADVPVNADLDGWTLREATQRREIWMSDDPDARILVAATPTPVGTQEDLDTRMLTGLADVPGVRVTATGPVDYEESGTSSVTRWQVRLIDGHQVSVGCQYRAGTAEQTAARLAACDRFTATARVG